MLPLPKPPQSSKVRGPPARIAGLGLAKEKTRRSLRKRSNLLSSQTRETSIQKLKTNQESGSSGSNHIRHTALEHLEYRNKITLGEYNNFKEEEKQKKIKDERE